jgi:hypothetical protein
MFERFTGPARRVIVLAHEGARMLRHDCAAAGRILPGPIRAGTGLAAPGAGVAAEPDGARFCLAGPARGSHVFGR